AKAQGAKTIVFVNKADSLMGQEADIVFAYESKALYIAPLAGVYLFALEVARVQGAAAVEPILRDLNQIPDLLKRQYLEEQEPAKRLAEQFKDETIFYTLGSGVLYGLAYKFGLTVFMENMRVHGSFMNAIEFRHGPVEMLEKKTPAFVVLLGNDESRAGVSRVVELLQSQQVPLIVYDMAKYPEIHPLLAPFALMVPLQWFAVYSAFLRGITDLDARVFMGRGLMGKGDGITWP
ncbi:sugar isomerase, partial [candidate division KSB3 bacterium]|nr:sugar isomerase [candidate division KSB3 bacterium]MBD3324019.1 sugar isomerase [candidate division KSB3 bacterium]